MHKTIHVSLVASLTIAGIGTAAAADSDPSVWRWHVANVLRAQQDRSNPPPLLREGRASAPDQSGAFTQHNERYFADGSLAPKGDSAHR